MPSFRTGRVTRLVGERRGLQQVEVDGQAAYALTDLVGPLSAGDRVVLNTTAVDLGLGTGGAHVVHWSLERDVWRHDGPGHVMKLRYTSGQIDAGAWGEDAATSDDEPAAELPDLAGLPVVATLLHSHLAPVVGAIAAARPATAVAWVMDDSAALPAALSDLVAAMRRCGLVHTVISCGQAFGGDHEAVNVAHGLQLAATEADVAVVGPGPGVVGTGSPLGFSSLVVAGHTDVATALGARCALAARGGRADHRLRHQGISHHTATVLRLAARQVVVPVPDDETGAAAAGLLAPLIGHHRLVKVPVAGARAALTDAGVDPTSMGRRLADDPLAFGLAAAGGGWAGTLLPT